MKKIFVVLIFIIATTTYAQESKQVLKLTLKSDKQVYKVGDEIPLELKLQNLSNNELIVFWREDGVVKGEPIVKHLGEGTFELRNCLTGACNENLHIPPKNSLNKRVVIKIEDFWGTLHVVFYYQVLLLAPVDCEKTGPNQQCWVDQVNSNTIKIEIVKK